MRRTYISRAHAHLYEMFTTLASYHNATTDQIVEAFSDGRIDYCEVLSDTKHCTTEAVEKFKRSAIAAYNNYPVSIYGVPVAYASELRAGWYVQDDAGNWTFDKDSYSGEYATAEEERVMINYYVDNCGTTYAGSYLKSLDEWILPHTPNPLPGAQYTVVSGADLDAVCAESLVFTTRDNLLRLKDVIHFNTVSGYKVALGMLILLDDSVGRVIKRELTVNGISVTVRCDGQEIVLDSDSYNVISEISAYNHVEPVYYFKQNAYTCQDGVFEPINTYARVHPEYLFGEPHT